MLDQEDLKWIAATTTELNTLLQQIARYTDLARQNKGDFSYMEILEARVELAATTAQAIFERVTSRITAATSPESPQRRSAQKSPPTFKVLSSVPLAQPQSPNAKLGMSGDLPSGLHVKNAQGPRELILIVDDEMEVAELCADMLATEGYKVVLAKDGFQALRIYEQIGHQIGLIVLDFFLPVMDGDAVFDELKAINPEVDVVLSSGFAEQSKLGQMLAQGLRGFIPKPYSRDKLLEQVRSTLDAAREQRR